MFFFCTFCFDFSVVSSRLARQKFSSSHVLVCKNCKLGFAARSVLGTLVGCCSGPSSNGIVPRLHRVSADLTTSSFLHGVDTASSCSLHTNGVCRVYLPPTSVFILPCNFLCPRFFLNIIRPAIDRRDTLCELLACGMAPNKWMRTCHK